MMKDRLQKIMAAAGLASRRQAETWITAGRVTVNGRIAELGESADPQIDKILVDGKALSTQTTLYYVLLNKPSGYVTSRQDPQGRACVIDLVKDLPVRLNPVGRLDLTTEGLLLLTNDGDLAYRLTHPSHEIDKTYLVRVRGELDPVARRKLEMGMLLDDGMTAPARVDHLRRSGSHSWFEITIHEGRNRQVRRMCEALGYPVSRLMRIRLGFLELGRLKSGEYRLLTTDEVAKLREQCNKPAQPRKPVSSLTPEK